VGLDQAAIEGLRAMITAGGAGQLAVGDLRAARSRGCPVMWRPRWAWWALAAELTVITVLTVAWRVLRAAKIRATAVMATTEDVTSAGEQERRDTGMPGERPDG